MICYFQVRRAGMDFDYFMAGFWLMMARYHRQIKRECRERFDHAQALMASVAVVLPVLIRRQGLSISGWLAMAGRRKKKG